MTKDYKKEKAKINWPATLVLGLTFVAAITIVPWYGTVYGFSGWAWALFAIFLIAGGIGIGAGYHRLWSHRAYEAHWLMRLYLAIVGGMTVQNSILVWCIRHRFHHRDVDDNEKDPYSIGRGFWFAHIGWMLKDYESGRLDWSIGTNTTACWCLLPMLHYRCFWVGLWVISGVCSCWQAYCGS